MYLSEKAKGKQRAAEPTGEPSSGEAPPKTKPLVIRFTEGFEDLDLPVEERDAIRDVKRKVRLLRLLCYVSLTLE